MPALAAFSRRDLCRLLPVLAATGALAAEETKLPSKAYRFADLTPHKSAALVSRPVLEGLTHDGYRIALHESQLAPGGMPHPSHHHKHEEMFMLREGTLEVTIAGKSSEVGPGGVVFVASNEEHGVKNAGQTAAQYFVLELGADQ